MAGQGKDTVKLMCRECGCDGLRGNAKLQFSVQGYTEEKVRSVERKLLGMKGVLFVHIHAVSGATEIEYDPKKTRFLEIMDAFDDCELKAAL